MWGKVRDCKSCLSKSGLASKEENGIAAKTEADNWLAHVPLNIIKVSSKCVTTLVVVDESSIWPEFGV